jgi:hypothetical protein
MSINKITYLDQFVFTNFTVFTNSLIKRFYFNDIIEVTQFLNELEIDKFYVVSLEFVLSWLQYKEDSPIIILSKPIIITKNSNPRLITNFIKDKIRLACDNHYLDDDFIHCMID